MRNALLTIHILAAAGFIGGGLYSTFVFPGDVRAMGLERVFKRDEKIGNRFFGTVVGLLLVSGIGLVLDSSVIGFGDAFVWIGIGAIVLSGVLEAVTFGPLRRNVPDDEGMTPRVVRALRLDLGAHLIIFVVTVYAMVAKIGVS